jgi:hypothetical protein
MFSLTMTFFPTSLSPNMPVKHHGKGKENESKGRKQPTKRSTQKEEEKIGG